MEIKIYNFKYILKSKLFKNNLILKLKLSLKNIKENVKC